jgi:hypothetical protein
MCGVLTWFKNCVNSLIAQRKLPVSLPGETKQKPLNTLSMKKTFPFFLAAIIAGCGTERAIQMNIADAELVKIDTIQRYPNGSEKLLTWRTDDRIDYVTFVPISSHYTVGSRMKVMVKR